MYWEDEEKLYDVGGNPMTAAEIRSHGPELLKVWVNVKNRDYCDYMYGHNHKGVSYTGPNKAFAESLSITPAELERLSFLGLYQLNGLELTAKEAEDLKWYQDTRRDMQEARMKSVEDRKRKGRKIL